MKDVTIGFKTHLAKIEEFIETGKFEAAGSAYLYLFSKTKNWKYANEAGICFQKVNMLSKASKAFKKALRTTSNRYAVLIHIGVNYSLAMDFHKAREILEEVLYQTTDPRAAYELGKIAYHQHLWTDALHYFNLSLTHQLIEYNSANNSSSLYDGVKTNLVFFYKAKIFGLELDHFEKACTLLQYLKVQANDKEHIFAFVKAAIRRRRKRIARFAAFLLLEDYKKHKAIQELYDYLEIS